MRSLLVLDNGLRVTSIPCRATEGFVSEEVLVMKEKWKVKMSMLFKWYANDFGKGHKEILRLVLRPFKLSRFELLIPCVIYLYLVLS